MTSITSRGRSIAGRTAQFDGADFYETPVWATQKLLEVERFDGLIAEPCSGHGAIARVLEANGYAVQASDLRTGPEVYGKEGQSIFDLPNDSVQNVVTNPPFALAQAVIEKSLAIAERKVAMLLKLTFLESARRHAFFASTPLKSVHVFCNRVTMHPYGSNAPKNSGTIAYAWFVWERGYQGQPTLGWLL